MAGAGWTGRLSAGVAGRCELWDVELVVAMLSMGLEVSRDIGMG